MTLTRIPKVLLLVAVMAVVYLMLTAVHLLGVAHASTEATPPAATGLAIDMSTVLLGLVALFTGLIMVFSGIRTFLAWRAPRTPATWDDNLLVRVTSIENWMRDVLALLPQPPRVPVPLPVVPPRDPQSGRAGLGMLTGLAIVGLVATALASSSCAGSGPLIRAKATIATDAFLACEEPNVSALAAEMTPYVVALIRSLVSDDPRPSAARLLDAAGKVTSMAGQCAWEAAIAVLMQSAVPTVAGASARSAPDGIDRAALAATWLAVRRDLEWAPAR